MSLIPTISFVLLAYLLALLFTAYVLSRRTGGRVLRKDVEVVLIVWGVQALIITAICLALLA